jgi:hypothetical protein
MIQRADVEEHLIGYLPYFAAVPIETMTRVYTGAIAKAADKLAGALQVSFEPKRIKQKPEAGLILGTDYDLEEPALDYAQGTITRDSLPRWTMRKRPIISVERLRFMLANREVYTVPTSWIQPDKMLGVVSLMPDGLMTATVASTPSSGAMWAPILDTVNWRFKVIPQFIAIDYTAGWTDFDTNPDTANIREMLATEAALNVLDHCRRLIPDSVNLDGFSQSFGSVERHIESMTEDVKKFIRHWRAKYEPPVIAVL